MNKIKAAISRKENFIFIAVLIMCVFLIASCGDNETTTTGGEDSIQDNPQTSESSTKEVEIMVTVPEGWEVVEGSVAPVQYMKGTASFIVKSEPFQSDTLDKVVAEALEIYKESFDNLQQQGQIETLLVDGKDARKNIFTCDFSGMSMKFEYIYLFVEKKVYVITFGDLASTFDSLSVDYETIVNQIKF